MSTQHLRKKKVNKENEPPTLPSNEVDVVDERVGEGDYALVRSGAEFVVCYVDKVLPSLEEATGLRLKKVHGTIYIVDQPCLIKIADVIKNVGQPNIRPTPVGVTYTFENLNL